MTLEEQLILHEGLCLKPYRDTVGKLTIGVGRNLDDKGISQREALLLLQEDLVDVETGLRHVLPWFARLSRIQQRVLIDMAFNLGITGLLKFKATLAAIEAGEYDRAANHMLTSKWARQVKGRAHRLAAMMREGKEVP
jgi:lysozyme